MSLQRAIKLSTFWFLLSVIALAPAQGSNEDRWISDLHFDELNQEAPDLSFVDATGKSLSLSSYRGKAILLHLWATWCKPCQKELPDLENFSKQLDSREWVFLPIAVNEPSERVQLEKFLKTIPVAVPLFQVRQSTNSEKYQTWGLPATYVISPTGKILARALGRRDWLGIPNAARDLNAAFVPAKKDK
jgi:thiol-disulfide isomerase/thioredoxin